jgi:hypothetical protein
MPFGAFAWVLHVGKDLAADYSPMPSGGSFALREVGYFPSKASVMRSKSIPAGSDAECLIGATASSRAKRRG